MSTHGHDRAQPLHTGPSAQESVTFVAFALLSLVSQLPGSRVCIDVPSLTVHIGMPSRVYVDMPAWLPAAARLRLCAHEQRGAGQGGAGRNARQDPQRPQPHCPHPQPGCGSHPPARAPGVQVVLSQTRSDPYIHPPGILATKAKDALLPPRSRCQARPALSLPAHGQLEWECPAHSSATLPIGSNVSALPLKSAKTTSRRPATEAAATAGGCAGRCQAVRVQPAVHHEQRPPQVRVCALWRGTLFQFGLTSTRHS